MGSSPYSLAQKRTKWSEALLRLKLNSLSGWLKSLVAGTRVMRAGIKSSLSPGLAAGMLMVARAGALDAGSVCGKATGPMVRRIAIGIAVWQAERMFMVLVQIVLSGIRRSMRKVEERPNGMHSLAPFVLPEIKSISPGLGPSRARQGLIPAQNQVAKKVHVVDLVAHIDAFAGVITAHRAAQMQSRMCRRRKVRKITASQSIFCVFEGDLSPTRELAQEFQHAPVRRVRQIGLSNHRNHPVGRRVGSKIQRAIHGETQVQIREQFGMVVCKILGADTTAFFIGGEYQNRSEEHTSEL